MRKAIEQAFVQGKQIVALDAPTLFEAGLDAACARILTVTAPKEERLLRIRRRDGISEEEALLRLSAQREEAFYTDRADHVIENRAEANLAEALVPVLRELRIENGGACS